MKQTKIPYYFNTFKHSCIALLLTACGTTDAAGTDKPMSL